MYSTSLGNSVMTSTSCSRGRQKLRFQISRKVRTARDRDRDYKEAPREAEPSRPLPGQVQKPRGVLQPSRSTAKQRTILCSQ